ncbi:MAG TPA: hypothetical protein VK846_14015 [Candidatus Limnocylindria bacterium]|nr:hypothetical protein [Candidatus Limnocylindria bacterium]
MKRRIYIWTSLLAIVLLGWGGYRAYLAHQNLVTLNVRDADVRDVIRRCEWQTWETIVVHKDVKGKVTLNVRGVPLEEVLGIIGDQTSSRSIAVYPIYSKNNSFVNLRKLARGDIYRDTAGWTNFSMIGGNDRNGGGRGGPGGRGGGFGGFSDTVRSQNSLVNLNISAKDVGFAALALARYSNAQVVPEDGANGLITLSLKQVPFTKAVAKVAKEANRKWDVFYSLQAQPEFFGRGDGPPDGGRGFRNRDDDTNRLSRADQFAALREREMEARLATMTPEEQAKAKEDQKKMEDMRNMSPEERQQVFQEMASNPANQQRMENRGNSNFKNSTPEQRVDQARRRSEARNRRMKQNSR